MPRHGKVAKLALSLTLLICAATLWAAETPEAPDQKGNSTISTETTLQRPLRVEVPLVLVPISVIIESGGEGSSRPWTTNPGLICNKESTS